MQKIIPALKQNIVFFGGFLLVLVFSVSLLIINGNNEVFISQSNFHPFFLNVFFINYTFMGDGIFALCLVAFMFFYFKKKKAGFALLYSLLIAGFAIQLTKNLAHLAGPKIYFEAGTNLNFTNGGSVTEIPGFPSGHTAIAFALATVLVLLFKRKNMQLPLLLGAVLLGYSRMYLAQHFLTDIITGALLGTISGVLSFYLVQNSISIKRPFKNIYQASSRPESSPGTMQTA